MDDDYFLGNKRKKKKFVKLTDYFGKIKKTGKIKKINILIFIILALSAKLFFGVFKEKSMFGKTFLGIERTTFYIVDGTIKHVWRKVSVQTHVQDVVQIVNNLN